METTSAKTPVTVGELVAVATQLRALGAATFRYKDCEVAFFPPDVVPPVSPGDEDAESKTKRLARLRKEQADVDLYGSS